MVVEHHQRWAGDHLDQRLVGQGVENGTHRSQRVAQRVGEPLGNAAAQHAVGYPVAADQTLPRVARGGPVVAESPLQTILEIVVKGHLDDGRLNQNLRKGQIKALERGLNLGVLTLRAPYEHRIVQFVCHHANATQVGHRCCLRSTALGGVARSLQVGVASLQTCSSYAETAASGIGNAAAHCSAASEGAGRTALPE